ncbi:MAG: hypothetical protein COB24_05625 [Hyphomicrobiales bacterium]|nr:MAG: hypothetical protein COB24_05625 [Hyphomicrobiales bacterium]
MDSWTVYLSTFGKAFLAAILCLLVGYPAAVAIHFIATNRWAFILMALFTIMINDVMRVVNFPQAFAISSVALIFSLIKPSIEDGIIFSFLLSLNEFSHSSYLVGRQKTLPLTMFDSRQVRVSAIKTKKSEKIIKPHMFNFNTNLYAIL